MILNAFVALESNVDDDEQGWAFIDLWGWMLFKERRPGMIGQAVGVSEEQDGPWELQRLDSGNWARSDGREIELEGVISVLESQELAPRWVHVAPQLEGQLFQEAVARASESVRRLDKASTRLGEELSAAGLDLVDMVMVTADLDRAMRAAVSSIVLAIAAGEAQVNAWASAMGGWLRHEDRDPLHRKCRTLTERAGSPLPLGEGCLQELHQSIEVRNSLVHPSPLPQAVRLGTRAPGTTISIAARTTCVRVRAALLATSRALGVPDADYLAYCPTGPAEDASAWRSAEVLTGIRPDPDFPPPDEQGN